tara:strand:- start:5134 stop:6555 length:1422 start_codon:yes stop_codon:yes gene_type:complete
MALPTFPIAPEGALTQSAATVAYSNLREGMAATARVMSQPAKREALREAYTLLAQQLNLPLTVFKEAAMTATGGSGGKIPPTGRIATAVADAGRSSSRMPQQAALALRNAVYAVAQSIDKGLSPLKSVASVVQGPQGRKVVEAARKLSPAVAAGAAAAPAAAEAAATGFGAAKAAAAGLATGAAALAAPALLAGFTAKAVYDLAKTQDLGEGLREVKRMTGKDVLTVNDLDMRKMGTYSADELNGFVDEGLIEQAVVDNLSPDDGAVLANPPVTAIPVDLDPAATAAAPAAAAPVASAPARAYSSNLLALGARGDRVTEMQQYLVGKGYDIGVDGVDGRYGADTKAAVETFQKEAGITVDGMWGDDSTKAAAVFSKPAPAAVSFAPSISPDVPGHGLDDPATAPTSSEALPPGVFDTGADGMEEPAVVTKNKGTFPDSNRGLDGVLRPFAERMRSRRQSRKPGYKDEDPTERE